MAPSRRRPRACPAAPRGSGPSVAREQEPGGKVKSREGQRKKWGGASRKRLALYPPPSPSQSTFFLSFPVIKFSETARFKVILSLRKANRLRISARNTRGSLCQTLSCGRRMRNHRVAADSAVGIGKRVRNQSAADRPNHPSGRNLRLVSSPHD